jgi:hypothetical protein
MTAAHATHKRAPPIEEDNPHMVPQLILANVEFLRLLKQESVLSYMARRYRLSDDPT